MNHKKKIFTLLILASQIIFAEDLTLTNQDFMTYFKETSQGSKEYVVDKYDNITFKSVFDTESHSGTNINNMIEINKRKDSVDNAAYTVNAKNIKYDGTWYRHNAVSLTDLNNTTLNLIAENEINIDNDNMYDRPGLISIEGGENNKVNLKANKIILKSTKKAASYSFEPVHNNLFGVYSEGTSKNQINLKASDYIELEGFIGAGYNKNFYAGVGAKASYTSIFINKDSTDTPDIKMNTNIETFNFNQPNIVEYRHNQVYVKINKENSYLKGYIWDRDSYYGVKIDLEDDEGTTLELENGGAWWVSSNSKVARINLNEGGAVISYSYKNYKEIIIHNLKGTDGRIELNIDASQKDKTDTVYIHNHKGKQYLKLNNVGSNADGADQTELIYVKEGDGVFEALDNDDNIFFEKYELKSKNETKDITVGFNGSEKYNKIWYLSKTEVTDKPTPIVKEIEASLEYKFNALRTPDTFANRLGSNFYGNTIWFRHRKDEGLNQEVGISYKNVGLGFSFGSKYALSLYGTKVFDNGSYIDGVLAVNMLNTKKKEFKTKNYSLKLSAEAGIKKEFSNGIYIVPQAQLTYTHIFKNEYSTENKIKVYEDGIDSLVARVGANVGIHIKDKLDVYAKVNLYNEFLGKQKIRLAKGNQKHTIEKNHNKLWLTYGLGGIYRVNKNLSIYGDFTNELQFNLGVKYIW